MKPCTVLPIVFACALLTACGGGGSGAPPVTSVAPTQPTDPTPPADPAPPQDIVLAAGYTPLSATVTFSTPNWPDWSHGGTAAVDGVACASTVAYHIHALLSIYRDGSRLALPGSVGRAACNYEMHTHDGSGVVHIETDVAKVFTLGQFFALWGQPLGTTAVAGLAGTPTFYVIDNETVTRVTTDPAALTLDAHREIVIVTGTPPVEVPRYDWKDSGL